MQQHKGGSTVSGYLFQSKVQIQEVKILRQKYRNARLTHKTRKQKRDQHEEANTTIMLERWYWELHRRTGTDKQETLILKHKRAGN